MRRYALLEHVKDVMCVAFGLERRRDADKEYDLGLREYPWVVYADPAREGALTYRNRETGLATDAKPPDFDARAGPANFLTLNTEASGVAVAREDAGAKGAWERSLEALRTTRYVVWYPATSVPDFRLIDLGAGFPGSLKLATDSSAAVNGDADDWYALSWVWTVGDSYQQVFVAVSQQPPPHAPPRPAPPSLKLSVLAPILWLGRQQADPDTVVDAIVSARARQVSDDILRAAPATAHAFPA